MSTNPEDIIRYSEDRKPIREVNAYSIDSVESEDDLYDFRPKPMPSDAVEEEEVPKDSPAMEPAESSDSPPSEPQPPATHASAGKVKSPAKTAV